jgi:hypothetical protein
MPSFTSLSLLGLAALGLAPFLATSGASALANNRPQRVSLNGRIGPSSDSGGEDAHGNPLPYYVVPDGYSLVITDIFLQNRDLGDSPVPEQDFSRIVLSGDPDDWFVTVVGNTPAVLNFTTGIRVNEPTFRVGNIVNSTAPFIEFQINGVLERRQTP